MKEIKTFISNDGIHFDDAKKCAFHELENNPEIVKDLNDYYIETYFPRSYDYRNSSTRWCNSEACGCTGCDNFYFYDKQLNQYHWEVWQESFLTVEKLKDGVNLNKPIGIKITLPQDQTFLIFSRKLAKINYFISNIQGMGKSELAVKIFKVLKSDSIFFKESNNNNKENVFIIYKSLKKSGLSDFISIVNY